MLAKLKNIGPASLVAAAFIGPGTVTLCSIAGYSFGYALLWALGFSIIATIILQEMAGRLGIVSGKGLGEALRSELKNPILKLFSIFIVIAAIGIGNAAYQAGNIGGAILGMETVAKPLTLSLGSIELNIWSLLIGFLAFALLFIGKYKWLEKVLIGLVLLMSFLFVITAILSDINWPALFRGLFVPSQPDGSWLTIIGLIGTTVVPYNLFLHASAASERWKNGSEKEIKAARFDTIVSILLGGLVSLAIVIAAAAAQSAGSGEISNAADLAVSLEPLLGSWSKYFVSFGLFAAGLTSSITAPLAAAYAIGGLLGWKKNIRSSKNRAVWITILFLGILFSSIGFKPIAVIKFAQFANGLLLPVIAAFLLYIMNKSGVLGKYKNKPWQNILGLLIVALAFGLGLKSVLSVLGVI